MAVQNSIDAIQVLEDLWRYPPLGWREMEFHDPNTKNR